MFALLVVAALVAGLLVRPPRRVRPVEADVGVEPIDLREAA
jgi:hypothetical protein